MRELDGELWAWHPPRLPGKGLKPLVSNEEAPSRPPSNKSQGKAWRIPDPPILSFPARQRNPESNQTIIQIFPFRILLLLSIQVSISCSTFSDAFLFVTLIQCSLFPHNGQACEHYIFCEASNKIVFMFIDASYQVIGNTNI